MGNLVLSVSVAYACLVQDGARPLGHVVAIGGSSASIRLSQDTGPGTEPARITIGNFLGIETDASRVVGGDQQRRWQ